MNCLISIILSYFMLLLKTLYLKLIFCNFVFQLHEISSTFLLLVTHPHSVQVKHKANNNHKIKMTQEVHIILSSRLASIHKLLPVPKSRIRIHVCCFSSGRCLCVMKNSQLNKKCEVRAGRLVLEQVSAVFLIVFYLSNILKFKIFLFIKWELFCYVLGCKMYISVSSTCSFKTCQVLRLFSDL